MKNTIQKFCLALIFISLSLTLNAQDSRIPINKIPKQITAYVQKHFPNNPVAKGFFHNHPHYKKYKVSLKDGVSLEFTPAFKITEIKSKSGLPNSVIPPKILSYVKAKYPKNVITDWELDNGFHEIELDNGLNIEFNAAGKMISIDD